MRFPLATEKLVHAERLLEILPGKQADHSAFDALLNACIDAARSVTFILKKEIDDTLPTLAPWYLSKQVEMALPKNNALPWLNEARRLTTHEQPIRVGTVTRTGGIYIDKIMPGEAYVQTPRGEWRRMKTDGDGKEVWSHASEFDAQVQSTHFIVDPPPPKPLMLDGKDLWGKDAVQVLTYYLRFLRSLLEEAEIQFIP